MSVSNVAAANEQVLVFPYWLIDEYLDAFKSTGGIITGDLVDEVFDIVTQSGELVYVDRESAEEEPDWKQVIPYTVLRRGREVFRYQRSKKGAEGRLHGKWSVGVGGHINPCDGEPEDAYDVAFWRELNEEVGLQGDYDSRIIALLYDDSDTVGQVHFGVVHQIQVGFAKPLQLHDEALKDGYWQHPSELRDVESFENWSRLVIPLL